jgi:ankyrin repeat protein
MTSKRIPRAAWYLLSIFLIMAGCEETLHQAIEQGNLERARDLLGKRAEVNEKDYNGRTPLHLAIQKGHKEIAELLIQNGSDINERNNGGMTPLHLAIVNRVTLRWSHGIEPRHLEIGEYDTELIDLLITKGADVNAKNHNGRTPLHIAVATHLQILSADRRWGLPEILPSVSDIDREMLRLLIDRGADVNTKDDEGLTPLHTVFVPFVLTLDTEGKTAAMTIPISLEEPKKKLIGLLIDMGSDINATDNKGETVLHRAIRNGPEEAAELLIARGADVNAKTKEGATSLHLAARKGYKELAELLISEGTPIESKDNNGLTPLDIAKSEGPEELVKLLIAKGAR